jgi:hypothetical protein
VKRHVVIALLLSGAGVLGLFLVLTGGNSVRDHIKETYRFVGTERVEGAERDSLLYASSKPPSTTAADIADARKPADRRVTESGVFLRYSDDVVSVVPQSGGSRIIVDDEDSGYRRNYLFVGGFWGTFSGRGQGFRGGGPGSGK